VTSSLPDLEFGPEWALLELLCLGLTEPEQQQMFGDLIRSGDLNWGELMEQALRHKMLPMLAVYTTSDEIEEFIPGYMLSHLQTILDVNKQKIIIFRKAAVEIVKALGERGVRFVFTKGIIFESTLYGGNGGRVLSDIDLMIAPKDRDIVTEALNDLGYKIGKFDWKTNSIKPHARKEMMIYQLNPDHIPIFIKLIDDSVVRCIYIDVANSLTWTRSPFDVPVEIALEDISYQPIPGLQGVQLPSFSPIFQFIFTILHLFREAWFESAGYNVNLAKFSDVIWLWRTYHTIFKIDDFKQTLEKYRLIGSVFWVLEHLDRTLNTSIISALGLDGRLAEEWLGRAYATGGGMCSWKGTMRDRLYCRDYLEVSPVTVKYRDDNVIL